MNSLRKEERLGVESSTSGNSTDETLSQREGSKNSKNTALTTDGFPQSISELLGILASLNEVPNKV